MRIGQMVKRGLPELLDRHIPRHGRQRGRSWGWTAVLWLADIPTEGDHRNVAVAAYGQGMPHTLRHLSGQGIAPLDFRDDLWSHLLQHVSTPPSWHRIERDLHARSIEVHALPQDTTWRVIAPEGERGEDGVTSEGHKMHGLITP